MGHRKESTRAWESMHELLASPAARSGLKVVFWSTVFGPWALMLIGLSAARFQVPLPLVVRSFLISQVHFVCYGFAFFFAITFMRTRPRLHWLVRAGGFFGISVIASFIAIWASELLGLDTADELLPSMMHSVGIGSTVSAVVLTVEWAHYRLFVERREGARRELEKERALRTMAEARWTSLESRMRPHFLFNTLSSIRELMHRDVRMADAMILRFAELVRFSLDAPGWALVPMAEELRMTAHYLAIEQMRLGARLQWNIREEPGTAIVPVPSLSILTLVENAVKHAVSPRREGGMVDVSVTLQGTGVLVAVRDSGPGFDECQCKPGHGLDMLRQRLLGLFGEEASLRIERGAGDSVHPTGGDAVTSLARGAVVFLRVPVPRSTNPEEADVPATMLRR